MIKDKKMIADSSAGVRTSPLLAAVSKVISFFKRVKPCNHLFKANEMQPRDENGKVKWECSRCHKLFVEECGLDVLRHGKCDGRWDLPNKYYELSKNGS